MQRNTNTLTRVLVVLVAVVVAGCGGGKPADGNKWATLSTADKRAAANDCIQKAAESSDVPASARAAVKSASPNWLAGRLNGYYTFPVARQERVQAACSIVLEQRFYPTVRIVDVKPSGLVPARERFLRIEGVATRGATVMVHGPERTMPATLIGDHFSGAIELTPGKNDVYAIAKFPDGSVQSPHLVVVRERSAENVAREEADERANERAKKSLARQRAASGQGG